MAKVVLVCSRRAVDGRHNASRIDELAKRLSPDNVTARSPLTAVDSHAAIGVLSPCASSPLEDMSAYVGHLVSSARSWKEPGGAVPEGAFALFRVDARTIELATDVVASRTIWYAETDDLFVASTSQRAIVSLLGSYRPNPETVSWMLSSGTLGPGLSWDARIRCLPGDSVLRFDRTSWTRSLRTREVTFDALAVSDAQHEATLKGVLEDTFRNVRLDPGTWRLALSGGTDSRALLLFLPTKAELRCVTWGVHDSPIDPGNDAYIAGALAKSFNLVHEFFATDESGDAIDTVLNRFVVTGEGRIDHVSAYMDGLRMWSVFHDRGVAGILRGDEGFGWNAVTAVPDVRRCLDAFLLSDFPGIGDAASRGLAKQTWPASLDRRDGESLATWRDRLYHEFRIPVILAALNDLKAPYVELANPLLSRSIIEYVRRLPDHLRTDKRLFRKIVHERGPRIGFAKRPAIADLGEVLKMRSVVEVMSRELKSDRAMDVIPPELLDHVLRNVQADDRNGPGASRVHRTVVRMVPRSVKNVLRATIMKAHLHPNVLAFRAYLVSIMNRTLRSDARFGSTQSSEGG